jgi:heterogeneous nuclear rnp K-like protein
VHDRVLTVTGALDGISKAYSIVAKGLLEGAPQMGMGGIVQNNGTHRKWTLHSQHYLPKCMR